MVDTNHGRLIAALSLTPIIEMCEVSYHQEQASINALNKNISFLHGTLAAMSKKPVPTSPTCVGFVRASILRKFNIFFWNTAPVRLIFRASLHNSTAMTSIGFAQNLSGRRRHEQMLVPTDHPNFSRAKKHRNIWPLQRKYVPLQSLNSTTYLIHNTLQNNV